MPPLWRAVATRSKFTQSLSSLSSRGSVLCLRSQRCLRVVNTCWRVVSKVPIAAFTVTKLRAARHRRVNCGCFAFVHSSACSPLSPEGPGAQSLFVETLLFAGGACRLRLWGYSMCLFALHCVPCRHVGCRCCYVVFPSACNWIATPWDKALCRIVSFCGGQGGCAG